MADMSYWQRLTQSRMTRRRALAGTAALGAGAAALSMVGCGGGDSGKSPADTGPVDKSGLLSTPQDTTAQAKPGGMFKNVLSADVTSLDPLSSSSFTSQDVIAVNTYPRMLKFKPAKYPNLADGTSEGDLGESYELSADKLSITFKIRQGMKWDSRTPTSGREIDAQDVAFSYNKFATISPLRGDFVYNAQSSPGAPVESVQVIDNRTVTFKMKFPDASIIPLFTTSINFFVMPRESDGGFDPKGTVRGYGPYTLEEYRPSSLYKWVKNPNYYVKDRPFIDGVENPIVPEYATRLAQFKAGNIWLTQATQQDVVQTKKDDSRLLLRQGESFQSNPTAIVVFGYEGNSPFKDERVRQAVSMLIDRELMTDTIGGRESFAKEGLDVPTRYHTVVGGGWEGVWIDPQDEKKFGPNAKYLAFNVAEAKKLLSAAGFTSLDSSLFYAAGAIYGSAYTNIANLLPGMMAEGGIKLKQDPKEYQTDWLPNYYYSYAQGEKKGTNGMLFAAERSYPTIASQFFATHHKDGPRFHGMTPNGLNPKDGDPQVNSTIEKIRGEFDVDKQRGLIQDLARYMTGKAYNIPYPTTTLAFGTYWPCVGNLGLLRTYVGGSPTVETYAANVWIDQSKPPFKTA